MNINTITALFISLIICLERIPDKKAPAINLYYRKCFDETKDATCTNQEMIKNSWPMTSYAATSYLYAHVDTDPEKKEYEFLLQIEGNHTVDVQCGISDQSQRTYMIENYTIHLLNSVHEIIFCTFDCVDYPDRAFIEPFVATNYTMVRFIKECGKVSFLNILDCPFAVLLNILLMSSFILTAICIYEYVVKENNNMTLRLKHNGNIDLKTLKTDYGRKMVILVISYVVIITINDFYLAKSYVKDFFLMLIYFYKIVCMTKYVIERMIQRNICSHKIKRIFKKRENLIAIVISFIAFAIDIFTGDFRYSSILAILITFSDIFTSLHSSSNSLLLHTILIFVEDLLWFVLLPYIFRNETTDVRLISSITISKMLELPIELCNVRSNVFRFLDLKFPAIYLINFMRKYPPFRPKLFIFINIIMYSISILLCMVISEYMMMNIPNVTIIVPFMLMSSAICHECFGTQEEAVKTIIDQETIKRKKFKKSHRDC